MILCFKSHTHHSFRPFALLGLGLSFLCRILSFFKCRCFFRLGGSSSFRLVFLSRCFFSFNTETFLLCVLSGLFLSFLSVSLSIFLDCKSLVFSFCLLLLKVMFSICFSFLSHAFSFFCFRFMSLSILFCLSLKVEPLAFSCRFFKFQRISTCTR